MLEEHLNKFVMAYFNNNNIYLNNKKIYKIYIKWVL